MINFTCPFLSPKPINLSRNLIGQRADPINGNGNDIPDIKGFCPSRCSHEDHITGFQGEIAAQVTNNLCRFMDHIFGVFLLHNFAIQPGCQQKVVGI